MRAVNLLPKDESYGHKSAPLPLLVGVGLAVVTSVALSAGFLQASGKVSDRQHALEDAQQELDSLPAPVAPISNSVETGLTTQQQQRVVAVGQALSRRVVWDRLLREVSEVLPEDVWLSSLTATAPVSATSTALASAPIPGAAPTGFTLNGSTYSQDGVARVLARIQVLPDLTNVQLQKSTLTRVGTRNVVTFTILADLRPPEGAS